MFLALTPTLALALALTPVLALCGPVWLYSLRGPHFDSDPGPVHDSPTLASTL